MDVDTIGRVGQGNLGLQQNTVDIDDFLQIFLTQLNFQDPLEPVDNREFIAQLASFSELEISASANDNLDRILQANAQTQALNLLGQTIDIGSNGSPLTGEVTNISFSDGTPTMTLRTADGSLIPDVSLADISLVRP